MTEFTQNSFVCTLGKVQMNFWVPLNRWESEKQMVTEVMTVSEVAVYLRVNPQTVYRKAKAGEMPALRIGRAIRFRKTELDEWMKMAVRPVVEDEVKV